jgi:hypothetical protein
MSIHQLRVPIHQLRVPIHKLVNPNFTFIFYLTFIKLIQNKE